MFDTHQYDLTFVPPTKEHPPEIVFIIEEQYLPLLATRLERPVINLEGHAKKYLNDMNCMFHFFEKGFFQTRFGYGECGYVTIQNGEAWLRLPINRDYAIWRSALTIYVLTRTLVVPFTEKPRNRTQQIELHTDADRFRSAGYGHAMFGYVSPSLIRWIKRYVSTHEKTYDGYWSTVIPEVTEAMQTVWLALCKKDLREYSDEIRAVFNDEGRFLFVCFGNACDFAIYPEQPIYDDDLYAQAGCHNLDSADQQLVILAGLQDSVNWRGKVEL